MRKQGLVSALISVSVLSIVIISTVWFILDKTRLIGPVLIILGLVAWIPIKISGRAIRSAGADIIFGIVDTGFLGVAALIGANYGGVIGAIVGGAVGDSITDGFAGIFEGKVSEYLRRHRIDEARTPISSSLGKMSGCLIGIGITLTIAWSVLNVDINLLM
ncbi:MAG: hypothetical protein KJ568_00050 [Actinobacteria bacterium]|nr:hypothetical protein [Actinomycetota bacterium]